MVHTPEHPTVTGCQSNSPCSIAFKREADKISQSITDEGLLPLELLSCVGYSSCVTLPVFLE